MGWFKWVVQELYLHKAVKKIKGQQRKDALYFTVSATEDCCFVVWLLSRLQFFL